MSREIRRGGGGRGYGQRGQDVRPRLSAQPERWTVDWRGRLLAIVSALVAAIPDFRIENAVRSDTLAGFVEEHDLRGTLPDGTVYHLAVCVVASVQGGKIVAVHEYFDTAAAAGLFKAMGG